MTRRFRRAWYLLSHRRFCFPCDRWTVTTHVHADATFSALLAREWRA